MKLLFALVFVAAFIYFGLFALRQANLLCKIPAIRTVPQLVEWGQCPAELVPLRDIDYEAIN